MMLLWYETDYYRAFRCKCGECRHTCCRGWQIDVTEQEYFRLIGMDCSGKLHHKLECAFTKPEEVTDEVYRVMAHKWQGDSHLLERDGMCMLQRERGETVLPKICRLYPRSLRREGNMHRACCSCSCEAVVETLLKQDRLTMVCREDDLETALEEDIPEGGNVLIHRCMRLLQDRRLPLLQRIHRICAATGCDSLPGKAEMDDALDTLMEMAPNLGQYMNRENPPDPDTERQKENLLSNHLIYMDFPFVDQRLATEDAGYGLMLAYALLCRMDGHQGDTLADAYAEAFRLIEHTSFYYNAKVMLGREKTDEK